MAKIYTVGVNHDIKTNSCNLFDVKQHEVKQSSTYMGVLKVFKKAFGLIDINAIIKHN